MARDYIGKMRLLILLFLFPLGLMAQDQYSLYFQNDKVEGMEWVKGIPEKYFGEFKLKETESNGMRVAAGDALKVDEAGIYIEKNRLLNISREEVRENSQYLVRDGWLFGVLEDDSLQVALSEELYYFLMPVKTYLFEVGSKNSKCYQSKKMGEYLVVSREEGQYVTTVFQFNGGSVDLKELNYDCSAFDLRKATTSKTISTEEGFTVYIIDPNEAEWSQILQCHAVYDSYSR